MLRNLTCPRCGHCIPNDKTPGAYSGALSRRDNLTEICSDCGRVEAFEDAGMLPKTERRYWQDDPAVLKAIRKAKLDR